VLEIVVDSGLRTVTEADFEAPSRREANISSWYLLTLRFESQLKSGQAR
jgi:hypothetical protein